MSKNKVALGSDHAGFKYKEKAKALVEEMGLWPEDFGAESEERSDYPEYGRKVAEEVAGDRCKWGLLVCGSGLGMSYTANRVKGIRASLCLNEEMAALARTHNDANILVLPERLISWEEAEKVIRKFFGTEFPGEERHKNRIAMIDE